MTQHSSPSNPPGSSARAWIARAALLSALTVAAGCGSPLALPGSVAASANSGTVATATSTTAGNDDRAPADTDSHDAGQSAASGRAQSSQCSSVQQYGITFAFDRQYPCGRFANGDYWVAPAQGSLGKVKIVSISPDFSGDHNGFEVNPSRVDRHGFDDNAVGYDATLVPTLPYSAAANQSIVKAISLADDDKTALDTAAVLTVLAAAPPDDGSNSFRPPYFGRNKPLYSVDRLRLDRLPAYAALPDMPSLSALSEDYARVQLDHQLGWMADQIHPKQNMPDYGAQIAIDAAAASLRLMVQGDAAERRQLAIHLVQYGIDLDAAMQGGLHFHADGGHRHGRKLILALSALLLDDPAMAARVRDFQQGTFQEDDQLYVGAGSGTVLFGSQCSAAEYWENQNTGNGSRDCRDPYGYIDGGQIPGDYYQLCCTAKGYKAAALALRLMPQLRCIWTDDRILRYADRWVQHGAWTQPDPYQPRGNGARDNNPADGIGRWPRQHGAARDDGYYGSDFADAMWTAYRAQASDTYSCP
ncbi:hypothetical protein [Lysobacter sp. CA199]|uniref:hypothetical protein n=1 Tax=Lysobacter sp. CA199 TaxID=3455608 RepID=UPI003F8D1057